MSHGHARGLGFMSESEAFCTLIANLDTMPPIERDNPAFAEA